MARGLYPCYNTAKSERFIYNRFYPRYSQRKVHDPAMSDKAKFSFLCDNPEKAMIIMFPLISFALFVGGAILWWLAQFILSF